MTRFKLWKDWYSHCTNHPVYKFLVLLRIVNSQSFEKYSEIRSQIDKLGGYGFSVHDELKDEHYVFSWGWYAVYLFACVCNGLVLRHLGCGPATLPFWIVTTMEILCFVSGAEYRRYK